MKPLNISDFEHNLSQKIREIRGLSANRRPQPSKKVIGDCLFGIEVELENVHLPWDWHDNPKNKKFRKYWNVENDGSLRHYGVEFVFAKPLSPAGVSTALTELTSFLGTLEHKPTTPQTTSTHIHIDVREDTLKDVLLFVALYYYFEQTLMNFCGSYRKKNLYCLTFKEASFGLLQIFKAAKDPSILRDMSDEFLKYGACNIAPISSFGSLEFRGLGGKTDGAEIIEWLNMLTRIKLYAKGKEFNDLIQEMSEPKKLFKDVFQEQADTLRKHFDEQQSIEAGFDLLYYINDIR